MEVLNRGAFRHTFQRKQCCRRGTELKTKKYDRFVPDIIDSKLIHVAFLF